MIILSSLREPLASDYFIPEAYQGRASALLPTSSISAFKCEQSHHLGKGIRAIRHPPKWTKLELFQG